MGFKCLLCVFMEVIEGNIDFECFGVVFDFFFV